MSGRNSNGTVKSGNREFPIDHINVFAMLRPDWASKISSRSLCWEVDIWLRNQDRVCDFPGNPAIELRFGKQDFGTIREVDASLYTTDDSLSGAVHLEYSQIDTGLLKLSWREDNSLLVEGEVETMRSFYNFQGIGNFTGIRVQDTGSMDVASAVELLKRVVGFADLDLNGILKSYRLPDGRDYSEILFIPSW